MPVLSALLSLSSVNNTPKTGSLPTDTSGTWQLRRADQAGGVLGDLTLTPDFGGTLITVSGAESRRIRFGVPLLKTGPGWVLEKLKDQLYNGIQIGTEADMVEAFGPDDISSGDGRFRVEVLDAVIPPTYTELATWNSGGLRYDYTAPVAAVPSTPAIPAAPAVYSPFAAFSASSFGNQVGHAFYTGNGAALVTAIAFQTTNTAGVWRLQRGSANVVGPLTIFLANETEGTVRFRVGTSAEMIDRVWRFKY